jgi:hypothetical protein
MDKMLPVLNIDRNNDRWWYAGNELHREDGPAVEFNCGSKFWYIHDKLHRTDGPAIMLYKGHNEWWLDGLRFTLNEWLDQNPDMTGEEKVMCKLEYG